MDTILVTGAGGYIGSVAVDLFLSQGFKIVVIDNFSTGFKKPLDLLQKKYGANKLKIYSLDLRSDNLDLVFEKEKQIKVVIHYAAFCSVDDSMRDPASYYRNNISGSINLISAMSKFSVKNLIFSSTCAVYGQSMYTPLTEAHPRKPVNPYGESKKIVEDMIQRFGQLKKFKFVILRYFNVCGATEDGLLGDSKRPSPHLVQNTVRASLGIDQLLLSYPETNTPDKSPIRDYVDVIDLASAHLKALKYILAGGESQIINLGTGKGYSVLEIIKTVEKLTGTKIPVSKGKLRQGDPDKLIASIKKAKKILGWEPQRNLEDSVKSLLNWYKKNPQGW